MPDSNTHNYLIAQFQKELQYHNHKEQMAYLIFGFEAAFFAGIFVLSNWPKVIDEAPKVVLVAGIVITWCMMHALLRFQLRLRRYSAISFAALVDTLEQQNSLTVKDRDIDVPTLSGLRTWIDSYVWPVQRSVVISDLEVGPLGAGTQIEPQSLHALRYHRTLRRIDAMSSPNRYAQGSEWIVTLGSMFLLLMALYRAIDLT
ncbi:MAG: hypothetical protein AAGH57_00105 [Pseudomonadota bacterium]